MLSSRVGTVNHPLVLLFPGTPVSVLLDPGPGKGAVAFVHGMRRRYCGSDDLLQSSVAEDPRKICKKDFYMAYRHQPSDLRGKI